MLMAVLAATLGVALVAAPAAAGGRPLSASLTGAAEVSPGDPDGSGTMDLTLNQGQQEICFDLTVANIAVPTRAHIHRGEEGVNGPIVVAFFDFVSPPPSDGCVTADAELIKEIRQSPSEFYVNVHNAEFPGGAIRGQLSK
jgi:hypothetical protein